MTGMWYLVEIIIDFRSVKYATITKMMINGGVHSFITQFDDGDHEIHHIHDLEPLVRPPEGGCKWRECRNFLSRWSIWVKQQVTLPSNKRLTWMKPFTSPESTTVQRSYGILTLVTPLEHGCRMGPWGAKRQNREFSLSGGHHHQIE